jgi:glycosyltransferase involved in cell wall biosynthesis
METVGAPFSVQTSSVVPSAPSTCVPDVTVIVPVYNNRAALVICIDCLLKQTYPQDRYQIIIVNNNSTESFLDLQNSYSGVTWLFESKRSSYAARNKGLLYAKGDIILFTDSDCIPDTHWVAHSVAALQQSGASIIGGRIDFIDPVDRPINVFEAFEAISTSGLGRHEKLIARQQRAVTANLATYKRMFEQTGYFDSELKSGGDFEWVERALAKGGTLQYAHDAIVHHPRRSSWRAVYRKTRRTAGGRVARYKKLRKHGVGGSLWDELFRYSIFDPRAILWALRGAIINRYLPGIGQRTCFFGFSLAMRTVVTFERFRVMAGGDPIAD